MRRAAAESGGRDGNGESQKVQKFKKKVQMLRKPNIKIKIRKILYHTTVFKYRKFFIMQKARCLETFGVIIKSVSMCKAVSSVGSPLDI